MAHDSHSGHESCPILDFLIRNQHNERVDSAPACPCPPDIPMTVIDDPEDPPTPWSEGVHDGEMTLPPAVPDACVVVFRHEFATPVQLKVSDGGTIHDLIRAHHQLVGSFQAVTAHDSQGAILGFDHVLQNGQVICICCDDGTSGSSDNGAQSTDCLPPKEHPVSTHGIESAQVGIHVSPTAPWTLPVCENDGTENGHFGPHDAGCCETPAKILPDCDSWISAAPLLGLHGDQFTSLKVPFVTCPKLLWALKHQLLRAEDRLQLLRQQEGIWSDDEFRYHITLLMKMHAERVTFKAGHEQVQCFMLDPLLLTGWAHHGAHQCQVWAQSHPDLRAKQTCILSACMLDKHWVPVVQTFLTWDVPQNSHDALNGVIAAIGKVLGFVEINHVRHQRLFFSTDKCGALALSFCTMPCSTLCCRALMPKPKWSMIECVSSLPMKLRLVSWDIGLGFGGLGMMMTHLSQMNQVNLPHSRLRLSLPPEHPRLLQMT